MAGGDEVMRTARTRTFDLQQPIKDTRKSSGGVFNLRPRHQPRSSATPISICTSHVDGLMSGAWAHRHDDTLLSSSGAAAAIESRKTLPRDRRNTKMITNMIGITIHRLALGRSSIRGDCRSIWVTTIIGCLGDDNFIARNALGIMNHQSHNSTQTPLICDLAVRAASAPVYGHLHWARDAHVSQTCRAK